MFTDSNFWTEEAISKIYKEIIERIEKDHIDIDIDLERDYEEIKQAIMSYTASSIVFPDYIGQIILIIKNHRSFGKGIVGQAMEACQTQSVK